MRTGSHSDCHRVKALKTETLTKTTKATLNTPAKDGIDDDYDCTHPAFVAGQCFYEADNFQKKKEKA